MKKAADILLKIFSIGVLLTLLAGGASVIGYIVALCIGGTVATDLCHIILKEYFPWIIKATSLFVACGLIGMYLEKKKALVIESEDIHNAEPKNENKE